MKFVSFVIGIMEHWIYRNGILSIIPSSAMVLNVVRDSETLYP
jgi:hypothetical protein